MSCGAKLEAGAKFCISCGATIKGKATPPEQPQTQQPSTQPQQQQPVPVQTLKKPKTKLIMLITAVVVIIVVLAVLFLVFLSDDTSKFVGTWTIEYLHGRTDPDLEWTFYTNGTYKSEQPGYPLIWINFELSGDRFCTSSNEYTYYHCYDYEFSNGGNKLTLSARGEDSIILTK